MLCLDGDICRHVTIRQQFPPNHIKKHNFDKTNERVDDFDMAPFANIMKALQYTGGACVNFKWDGLKLDIFEINPRFGGSAFTNQFLEELLPLPLEISNNIE